MSRREIRDRRLQPWTVNFVAWIERHPRFALIEGYGAGAKSAIGVA